MGGCRACVVVSEAMCDASTIVLAVNAPEGFLVRLTVHPPQRPIRADSAHSQPAVADCCLLVVFAISKSLQVV